MNDLMNIDQDKLTSVLSYGSDAFDNKTNRNIPICNVQFTEDSRRFDDSTFKILSTLLDFANSNIVTSLFLKVCVSSMTLIV